MGVHFVAFADHGLESLQKLDVDRLLRDRSFSRVVRWAKGAHEHSGTWVEGPRWRAQAAQQEPEETLRARGMVDLDLPGGFRLTFGQKLVRLHHPTPWHRFLTDGPSRRMLRDACVSVGRQFHAKTMCYLPDSTLPPSTAGQVLQEGGDVKALRDWLRKNGRPPGLHAEILYPAEFRGMALANAYIVEYLEPFGMA